MLPTSVQSRLPAFQSFRRSASLSILSSRRRSASAQKDAEPAVLTNIDEDSVVELQTRAAAAAAVETNVANRRVEEDTSDSLSSTDGYIPRLKSGVKWRYAAQGSYLQHSASRERDDIVFARKSYIDGVAYMLRALPDDMDAHEVNTIRRALPNPCGLPDANGQTDAGFGRLGWQQPPSRAKTFLRSTVQGFVAGLVVFIYSLLSLLAVVIRVGAHYERQYNISEHLVSLGLVFASTVGKQSGALSGKISAISEGKFGRVVTDLAAWTVESVTGGIQDGIGQALLLIEQKRK
ncbi:hypothetical protein AAE478_001747 [Parahypoxylon ruwenzoriense]